jgi:hypothetical protein
MFCVRYAETGNWHGSHICIHTILPGTAASLSIWQLIPLVKNFPTFYGTWSPLHKTLYISNHHVSYFLQYPPVDLEYRWICTMSMTTKSETLIHWNLMMCWEIMNDYLNNVFKANLNNNLHTVVLWVATPCSLVGGHQSFGETHHNKLYFVLWRWRQYCPAKHEYQPTTQHGVIT